jgi:osmoprotectant transport system ATP-binding protein
LRNQLQKTSIFVTHDVREALRLGTRIALLDRGRLEVLATPQEFVKSWEPVTRTFLAVLDTDMEMDAGDLG